MSDEPFDNIRIHSCRWCRGSFFEGDMRPAREVRVYGVLDPKRRGWYCRLDSFMLNDERQEHLPGMG